MNAKDLNKAQELLARLRALDSQIAFLTDTAASSCTCTFKIKTDASTFWTEAYLNVPTNILLSTAEEKRFKLKNEISALGVTLT